MEERTGTHRLETKRLILRDICIGDAEKLFEMDSDPLVIESLFGIPPPTSVDDSIAVIKRLHDQYNTNGFGRWAIVEKESGLFQGWAGIKLESNVNGREKFHDLGYRLLSGAWGKGIATEASIACMEYGFEVLGAEKICSYIESSNVASRRVAEKAGLRVVEKFQGIRMEELWMEEERSFYLEAKSKANYPASLDVQKK